VTAFSSLARVSEPSVTFGGESKLRVIEENAFRSCPSLELVLT
jgi:hypothetical protein